MGTLATCEALLIPTQSKQFEQLSFVFFLAESMFFIQPDPIPAHRLAENLSVCRKKKRKAEDRVTGFECITFNLFGVDPHSDPIRTNRATLICFLGRIYVLYSA